GDTSVLPTVFSGIGERARHLHEFVSGYASFARLPAPRLASVPWSEMIAELQQQYAFRVDGTLPVAPGWFDRAQVEQALINLLKNAHEAGGPAADVELSVVAGGGVQQIQVRDRGAGMPEAVLVQATLPFYSTKRSGSGLGLALVREIAEAHGGQLRIANRAEGGLAVTLVLPVA
ncbi:MAG: ATP-binding protein, partial [Steroidobacteraceae bacterium]